MIKDFLKELKDNQRINKQRNIENRVDISYVIERLEDIQSELELTEQYIIFYKQKPALILYNSAQRQA